MAARRELELEEVRVPVSPEESLGREVPMARAGEAASAGVRAVPAADVSARRFRCDLSLYVRHKSQRSGVLAVAEVAGRVRGSTSAGAAARCHSPTAAVRGASVAREEPAAQTGSPRRSRALSRPFATESACFPRKLNPSPRGVSPPSYATASRNSAMSFSWSSTQSPGLREKMISLRCSARTRRSSGSMVRAR